MARLPWTLAALFRAFRPGGCGIPDSDFWGFGPIDAGFRTWYTKIARDFQSQGRFGFAWDDGLGMALGPRIYNNFVTYKLLYWLGQRRMLALAYLMAVAVCAVSCGWRLNPWAGILVGVLFAGSPLAVACYTHYGKPEALWWGLAQLFVVCAFTGHGLWAGLLWSFLACVSLSVSVMIPLMLGPALFVYALSTHTLGGLALGVAPGAAKIMLRGINLWRTGYLGSLVSTQSGRRQPLGVSLAELLAWWAPFIACLVCCAYASHQFAVAGSILASALGLFWLNGRMIYVNDPNSFYLAFWAVGAGYSAATRSFLGLLCILFMAYNHPLAFGITLPLTPVSAGGNALARRLHHIHQVMARFPRLAPLRFLRPAPLIALFDQMPNGSRFLFESDGDPRMDSKFRAFGQWTEEFLPQRHVDQVYEAYTRHTERDLTDRWLSRFTAGQMTAHEMDRLCQALGVSYVVAYNPATLDSLQSIGYQAVAQADLGTLGDFSEIVHVPPVTLVLLRNPSHVTVIEPAVAWERQGNVLTWSAEAGQSYVVRYRYCPEFQACQNGEALAVEPTNPIEGISLTFVRVNAVADGPIALTFRPRWV